MALSLLLSVALALGAQAAARPASAAEPRQELAELATRDARLSFTADSAARARAVLDAPPAEGHDAIGERMAAVLALGGGGGSGDVARVEALLEKGGLLERRAALFALGELAADGWPALERALARDTTEVEEALCLALLLAERGGVAAAGERLQTLGRGDDRLARRARLVLARRAGEEADWLADTLRAYYELRWRAARTYGLIDGQRAQKASAAELFRDSDFLDRVVLAAAATELPAERLKAHLSELLFAGDDHVGALRAAVAVMPDELARAHEAGEWKPSLAAWDVLLSEIDARHSERGAMKLLSIAYGEASELEPHAGRLLLRGGGDLPWEWVEEQLETGDPGARVDLVEALGERGEKSIVPDLAELIEERPELELAGVGLVALARLGHAPAKKTLQELVEGPVSAERDDALAAMARVLHVRELQRLAEQALRRDDVPAELRFDLLAGLLQNGVPADRAALRAALPEARPGARLLAGVRALARAPEKVDLEALAGLFPVGRLEADVELALCFLRHRHPATGGLLSSALWTDAWNRSVLSGGLIARWSGVGGLIEEIDTAPRTATERDLRRVGFAVGEWGGMPAVEDLARKRSEGDPVLQGALLGALSSRPEAQPKALILPSGGDEGFARDDRRKRDG